MTDNVYLNADKTKVVPQYADGKKWQVPRRVAVEMGLLPAEKPAQERRPQKRRTSKPE